MFNEFMFMILLYHLFLFSDFTLMRVYHPNNYEYKYVATNHAQEFFGYTYLACMLILTFVNMIVVVLNTSDKMKQKNRLKKIKKIREQRMQIVEMLFDLKKA